MIRDEETEFWEDWLRPLKWLAYWLLLIGLLMIGAAAMFGSNGGVQ